MGQGAGSVPVVEQHVQPVRTRREFFGLLHMYQIDFIFYTSWSHVFFLFLSEHHLYAKATLSDSL